MNTNNQLEPRQAVSQDSVQVSMSRNGLGTMYPAGAIIGMLLQMEPDYNRVNILADVIETIGIDPGDVIDRLESYVCRHCVCRTSRRYPCDCNRPFNPETDALPTRKEGQATA